MLLDPGMSLTLRPMRYPDFFERYKDAIKNTWTVDEVDFSTDLTDLRARVTPAERHRQPLRQSQAFLWVWSLDSATRRIPSLARRSLPPAPHRPHRWGPCFSSARSSWCPGSSSPVPARSLSHVAS